MNDVKVAYLTNIIPKYREGLYDRLFSKQDVDLTVFCQSHIHLGNYECIHQKYPTKNVQLVDFIKVKNQLFEWQFLPWKNIYSNYEVIIVDGNPRNLSHLFLAIFLKIAKKRVIIYSMLHSYRNNKYLKALRVFGLSFFEYHLVYVEKDIEYLVKRGFDKNKIIAYNNGLDQKKIDLAIENWGDEKLSGWKKNFGLDGKTIVLSCGRLIKKNNYDLLVKALPLILEQEPNLILCIIGEGDQKLQLQELISNMQLSKNVFFVGEVYDPFDQAPWFLSAQLFIHPAAIGLSLLNAFGFGLPVITHNNELKHGPEFSIFKENLTGSCFKENDFESLAETTIALLQDNSVQQKMKVNTLKLAREDYNIDVMAERFSQIIKIANK